MAVVDINGKLVEFPDDLAPDQLQSAVASAATQLGSPAPPSLEGFRRNTFEDVQANVKGLGELAAFTLPPLTAMKTIQGENVTDPGRVAAMGGAMVQGLKQLPGQLLKTATHPVQSMYERPLSTALDLSMIGEVGGAGMNLARAATKGVASRIAPGTLRFTAGAPDMATEIAMKKPAVLAQPPVPEAALNEVVGQPLVDAMQLAKKNVGDVVSKAFRKYANMEGPMQEIINTPIAQKLRKIETETKVPMEVGAKWKTEPVESTTVIEGTPSMEGRFYRSGRETVTVPGERQVYAGPREEMTTLKETSFKPGELTTVPRKTHSYDELLINHKLADEAIAKGDADALAHLYKEYVGTGKSNVPITNADQLQILTRLKREIQQQAEFNKAPITLKPIDSAKDAAFKKMAADIDELRGNLPNGEKLAAADNAWKEINDIYDTVQRDLSDPGKAKDTMMRLLRGDQTWLTSGRMKGKVDAIRRAERLSGKKILEPALEELTRQVFNQWVGKGLVSHMFKAGSLILGTAGAASPALLPIAAAGLASSSPRVAGGAIKKLSALGSGISKIAPRSPRATSAAMLSSAVQARKKTKGK